MAGVEFRLKVFRPSFAQMSLDLNPNLLPDVSTIWTREPADHEARLRADPWEHRPAEVGRSLDRYRGSKFYEAQKALN